MIQDQDFQTFNYNILGTKSKIRGDLHLYGDAIITSEIEGNIVMHENGKLVLERGSFVKGKIEALEVEVFGKVEGDIYCKGVVSVRSSAEIQGTIKSSRLVIYPGAIIDISANSEEK